MGPRRLQVDARVQRAAVCVECGLDRNLDTQVLLDQHAMMCGILFVSMMGWWTVAGWTEVVDRIVSPVICCAGGRDGRIYPGAELGMVRVFIDRHGDNRAFDPV